MPKNPTPVYQDSDVLDPSFLEALLKLDEPVRTATVETMIAKALSERNSALAEKAAAIPAPLRDALDELRRTIVVSHYEDREDGSKSPRFERGHHADGRPALRYAYKRLLASLDDETLLGYALQVLPSGAVRFDSKREETLRKVSSANPLGLIYFDGEGNPTDRNKPAKAS